MFKFCSRNYIVSKIYYNKNYHKDYHNHVFVLFAIFICDEIILLLMFVASRRYRSMVAAKSRDLAKVAKVAVPRDGISEYPAPN